MTKGRDTQLIAAISKTLLKLRKEPHFDTFDTDYPSQREIAEMAEIHLNYYSELERGLKMPTIEVLLKIARVYKMPLTQLVSEIENNYNKLK